MGRRVNRKCQHCAALKVEDAIALHGSEGDHCWNPRDERNLGYDCHRRRNHYRYRQEENTERRLQRRKARKPVAQLAISTQTVGQELPAPPTPEVISAVLVLYRQKPNTPVHAVAAEVWQSDRRLAGIQPVHCMGMRGDQISEYIRETLQLLNQHFGIGRFEDVVKELPVHQCPIKPCPFQEGR